MKHSISFVRYVAGSAAALLLTIACGAANAETETQEVNGQSVGNGSQGSSVTTDPRTKVRQRIQQKQQEQSQNGGNGKCENGYCPESSTGAPVN